jgi:hypothetical protein
VTASPILAVIDRMMAAPVPEKPVSEAARNPHAGAAAAGTSPAPPPVLGPKAVVVDRSSAPLDALDQAAELFKVVFKGEIVP